VEAFKIGDRVEIVGDIAQNNKSKVGIITGVLDESSSPSRKMFKVRLADGASSTFFDSQLQAAVPVPARTLFDSSVSPPPADFRGPLDERHLLFVARNFDIHMRITGSAGNKKLIGEVTPHVPSEVPTVVILFSHGEMKETVTADSSGEFSFQEVPMGDLVVEILVPACRIVTSFSA
jgi:hypothetical protein